MIDFQRTFGDFRGLIVLQMINYINGCYQGELKCNIYVIVNDYDDVNDIECKRFINVKSLKVNNNNIDVAYEAEGNICRDNLDMFSCDDIYNILTGIKENEVC